MNFPIYKVDAFTNSVFGGNPAGVVPLEQWIPEDVMQKIGAENNLPETAFIVPKADDFEIRWFTPKVEIDLCGHATLASAHVIFNHLGYTKDTIRFYSEKSGELIITRKDGLINLNFPASPYKESGDIDIIEQAIGVRPEECYAGKYAFAVLKNEEEILNTIPNLNLIKNLNDTGLIITAPGEKVDFVSRFFAPAMGIDEDPVTGSAHTYLIPFWAKRLEKKSLKATQLSERRGDLLCNYLGDRVEMAGEAVTYLKGEIYV